MNVGGDCRAGLVTQRTRQQPSSTGTGTYGIPKGKLPFAHAAEASCEDVSISEENGSHGPGSLVGLLFLLKEIYRLASRKEQEAHLVVASLLAAQNPWQDTLLLHAGCRPCGATSNYLCPTLEGRNQLLNYKRSGHSWLVSALPIRRLQG